MSLSKPFPERFIGPVSFIMDELLNERAKQFLVQAAMFALLGVELCLIASEKASPGTTRDFARTALNAHCDIANAVVDTALSCGIAIPADFDEDRKNNIRLLLSYQSEQFDRLFVEILIAENEAAFFLHAGEAIQGGNSIIEGIASKALPLLEEQLSVLRSILPNPA